MSKEKLLDEFKVLLDNFFYGIKQVVYHAKTDTSLAEGQIFLLHILWERGTCKVSDIASRLGLTAGAVTAMTDKLTQMELIKRERSEEDRRVVWVSITDAGRQVIERIKKNRFEHVREKFKNLSEEDLIRTIGVFEKLNAELNQEKG